MKVEEMTKELLLLDAFIASLKIRTQLYPSNPLYLTWEEAAAKVETRRRAWAKIKP